MNDKEKAWRGFIEQGSYLDNEIYVSEAMIKKFWTAGWDAGEKKWTFEATLENPRAIDEHNEKVKMLNILANYGIKTPNKLMKVLRKYTDEERLWMK